MMNEKEKLKLYIIVPHTRKAATLLSCDNMKSMAGVAPTAEILSTHFQAERCRVAIWERDHPKYMKLSPQNKALSKEQPYKPQPLYMEVDSTVYESIIDEIRTKTGLTSDETLSNVVLTFSSAHLPCCIIGEFHPDEYEKKTIKKKK